MTDATDLFELIRARHGHYCPMSTLGGRLGLAAMQALGSVAAELVAAYHIDTCAADGIALATGCLPEEGRLSICNDGRHRLELRFAEGQGVCAELTAAALEQAAVCRLRLDAGEAPDLVLAALRNAPAEELMVVKSLIAGNADA